MSILQAEIKSAPVTTDDDDYDDDADLANFKAEVARFEALDLAGQIAVRHQEQYEAALDFLRSHHATTSLEAMAKGWVAVMGVKTWRGDSAGEREIKRAMVAFAQERGWPHDLATISEWYWPAIRSHCDNEREKRVSRGFVLGSGVSSPRVPPTPRRVDGEPLVEGLLPRGLPCVVGGAFKTYKTGLSLALGVCAVNAKPFLGLPIPRPLRVGVYLGEAQERPTLATVKRMARAINGRLDGLDLCCHLPLLTQRENLAGIVFLARKRRWDIVILDPLFRALGGKVDMSNLYAVAKMLRVVTDRLVKEAGCTPVFNHHAKKDLAHGRAMDLGDLLGAGPAEFFKSWLLINRVVPFDPRRPGHHDLVVVRGNSLGDAGQARLLVDEGRGDRPWSLRVLPDGSDEPDEADESAAPAAPNVTMSPAPAQTPRPKAATSTKPRGPWQRVLSVLPQLFHEHGGRVARKWVVEAAGIKGSDLTRLMGRLTQEGQVRIEREEYVFKGKKHERLFFCDPAQEGPSP